MNNSAILLVSCPDQKGITAAITDFVYRNNGNIVHADQHIDNQSNTFFMRIEWSLKDFNIDKENIESAFSGIAGKYQMHWELSFNDAIPNIALFVSKPLHCLQDLLLRKRGGQLQCQIPVIISNHADARSLAEQEGIDFHHIPVDQNNKDQQEQKEFEVLKQYDIDTIVLARYHQILSKYFVDNYSNKIVNIHHSFLPAFPGKNPYHQVYLKGVKIIGATSHYVTEALDDGPIIDQDTTRISHRDSLSDLVQKGQDLEKLVLYRAIKYHLEKKVLVYNNKTVIFD